MTPCIFINFVLSNCLILFGTGIESSPERYLPVRLFLSFATFDKGDWFSDFTTWMEATHINVILDEVGVPNKSQNVSREILRNKNHRVLWKSR